MRGTSFVALLGLVLAACGGAGTSPTTTSGATEPSGSPFLAAGDSYVSGHGVDEEQTWPEVLAAMARDEGLRLARPTVVAGPGWQTTDLLAALQTVAPGWGLVAIEIGVNDQSLGVDIAELTARMEEITATAIDLVPSPLRLVVLSIPDWSVTRYGETFDQDAIAAEIELYNEAIRSVVEKAGAQYVDLTSISRDVGHLPEMQADDGFHPSAAQHRLWAELLLPAVRQAMTE